MEARPIVKWVGGKRHLLPELLRNIPENYNRYFEPFLGGGALFFALRPGDACISDGNKELINSYRVVKDHVHELIEDLKRHRNSEEYFLKIRNIDRDESYGHLSDVQRASRFLYLNKTCFNGLYRVNSLGQFNVPFGHYKNPRIVDAENLISCSLLLRNAEIRHADFSEILKHVRRGDFVYFDPPYVPLSDTSNFTSYTKDGFDRDMQCKLARVCDTLHTMGVRFLLSNSDTELVHELYRRYTVKRVFAPRFVNACAEGRGKIAEVLVRNY